VGLSALLCIVVGCSSGKTPKSFTALSANTWSAIEIRPEVEYKRAWNTTLGILVRTFDLEMVLPDEGYIRTAWLYSWSGAYQANYRVRVTVKFADDRRSLAVKTEAQSLVDNQWLIGTDTRLVSTLKTDLLGTVGRTTR
jgi:hypothetical protein